MAGTTDIQNKEIEAIKSKYKDQCRIIRNIGLFSNVVSLRLEDMDLSIKFQLTENYPSEAPAGIVIVSSNMSLETSEQLRKYLTIKSRKMLNKPMMEELLATAFSWLKKSNIDLSVKSKSHQKEESPPPRAPVETTPKDVEEHLEDTKKPPMKTADDVVKRIMWDDSLPTEAFIVGYEDRFLGIQEKSFTSFSWEDIASVDYNVLAIPKHRIQYFKYHDLTFWDKSKRLDNMFGSTGSNLTISDVMKEYEAQQEFKRLAAKDEAEDYDDELEEDDDSDDDGITVQLTSGPAAASNDVTMDKNRMRPNHFICLRITSEEILDNVRLLQERMKDQDSRYADCYVGVDCLHVTLCTIGLDNAAMVQRCQQAFRDAEADIRSFFRRSITLTINGVSLFHKQVVFARVENNPTFLEYVDFVRSIINENGLEVRDLYDFTPHLTIMKTSRDVARNLGSRVIPEHVYEHERDQWFGEQIINNLYVCEMSPINRRDDGFYVSPVELINL